MIQRIKDTNLKLYIFSADKLMFIKVTFYVNKLVNELIAEQQYY